MGSSNSSRRQLTLLTGRVLTTLVLIAISQPALAQVNQPDLSKIVASAIADDSVLYNPPRVTTDEGVLNYDAGSILYPDYSNKPTQPLGFPADIQFKIELLRKFRAANGNELQFMEQYLAQMEKVVQEELDLINNNPGNREELMQQLAQHDAKAESILDQGIRAWASQQGLSVPAEKQSFGAALIPTVDVQTSPGGGTVYYLNAVDYNTYKAAGVLEEIDRWNQVAAPQVSMGGQFYFRAAWPDGRTKKTAKILIDKDQTLTLQAD